MCGRYSLGLQRAQIQQVRGWGNVRVSEWRNEEGFHPRHNVAPRSNGVIIRREAINDASISSERLIMQTMKWGLVPSWSKHEDKSLNTSNARAENLISDGGMWANIKGRKRCVVLCQGYFEWLKKAKDKLPFFTRNENAERLMLLAGLYDCASIEGGADPLWTFTIVTTKANNEFSWLHDRQPVVLSTEEAVNTWLDTTSKQWSAKLTQLVQPYSDSNSPLKCYQVPKEVGKVGSESEKFIEPVAERNNSIKAMFTKQKIIPVSPSPIPSYKKEDTVKRKCDPEEAEDHALSIDAHPHKQAKVEKIDAWEDVDEMEYVRTQTKNKPKPRARAKLTFNSNQTKVSSPASRMPKKHAEPSTKSLEHFFARK